ncbi:zinc finger BED domain-containing protein 5-like [Daktulosphaira vitifoliae]|uniref:zinc finger BED domain-containing protein 5-like n=1 Tax=Daktulosphaira vitifoliae TaxID=58002 RepID=UPI0021AACCEC|nr:zinc finger BED domain-containing protein 5-like [Daktulosphaira vitifoliae]
MEDLETYPTENERKTAVAELIRKSQQSTSKFNNWLQSASNLTAASFVVSHEIMKSGKPYTDGEYIKKCFIGMSEHLFSEFKNKTEIINKIKDIPLSATNVRDRAIRMAENISEQQFSDLKSSPVFSLACDESCDIKNIAQLTLMRRYVSSAGVHEELLGLLPLKRQTRGEDICAAITEFCKEKEINLDKLISLCTDGSPNMIGKYKGFITLFGQNVKHELLSFHCIVHQEALCAQTFPVEFNQVMALAVKIINKIIVSALNHRQFRALLDEVNARYKELLMFNNVRINYPELCDNMWLQKLYFAVDLTSSLNHLNKKLQGKGNTAHTLLETVLSFEQQLQLFSEDIDSGNLDHFESLKEYTESSGCIIDLDGTPKSYNVPLPAIELKFPTGIVIAPLDSQATRSYVLPWVARKYEKLVDEEPYVVTIADNRTVQVHEYAEFTARVSELHQVTFRAAVVDHLIGDIFLGHELLVKQEVSWD